MDKFYEKGEVIQEGFTFKLTFTGYASSDKQAMANEVHYICGLLNGEYIGSEIIDECRFTMQREVLIVVYITQPGKEIPQEEVLNKFLGDWWQSTGGVVK